MFKPRSELIFFPEDGRIDRVFSPSGKRRENSGYPNANGYIYLYHQGKYRKVHQLIWEHVHGEIPDGLFIDHINGVRSDNRICNLRLATRQQNGENRQKLAKNNTSGFRGVSLIKSSGKWIAGIKINGVRVHLGRFQTKEEAYKAYCDAAAKLHSLNPCSNQT